jgi:hypothetical protein
MHSQTSSRRALLKDGAALALATVAGLRPRPAHAVDAVPFSSGADAPTIAVPRNACDCHIHIRSTRFPASPHWKGQPVPDGDVAAYREVQARLGTSRVVVVTPSTYGTDNRATLDGVAQFGPSARAVVVVDLDITDVELRLGADHRRASGDDGPQSRAAGLARPDLCDRRHDRGARARPELPADAAGHRPSSAASAGPGHPSSRLRRGAPLAVSPACWSRGASRSPATTSITPIGGARRPSNCLGRRFKQAGPYEGLAKRRRRSRRRKTATNGSNCGLQSRNRPDRFPHTPVVRLCFIKRLGADLPTFCNKWGAEVGCLPRTGHSAQRRWPPLSRTRQHPVSECSSKEFFEAAGTRRHPWSDGRCRAAALRFSLCRHQKIRLLTASRTI